jgi:hypothetical protein
MGINEHTPIGEQIVWFDREKGEVMSGVVKAKQIKVIITAQLSDGRIIQSDADSFTRAVLTKD